MRHGAPNNRIGGRAHRDPIPSSWALDISVDEFATVPTNPTQMSGAAMSVSHEPRFDEPVVKHRLLNGICAATFFLLLWLLGSWLHL